jgi:ABC-type transport system involved in cytochrome c biogenesis permease subunit
MQKSLSLPLIALVLLTSTASAGDIDLTAWKSIPVFEAKNSSGRVEPLDSFARQAADDVCLNAKGLVKLGLKDYLKEGEKVEESIYKDAAALFPNGETRKFDPAELLLSWMVEPEKWESVPFIYAAHKDVRELLGVPERNDRGLHLKYVSPKQIFEAEKYRNHLRAMQQREEGSKSSELDKLAMEVHNRYQRYRAITLDPTRPLTAGVLAPPGSRHELLVQFRNLVDVYTKGSDANHTLKGLLETLSEYPERGLPQAARDTLGVLSSQEMIDLQSKLIGQWRSDAMGGTEAGQYDETLPLADAVKVISALREKTARLDDELAKERDRLFDQGTDDDQQKLGPLLREMAEKGRNLHLRAFEMNVALYEDGNCVRVVPALNAGALSKTRDPSVRSQPWYSLAAVLYGDELMQPYPKSDVRAVRDAWKDLREAYRDRDNSNRAAAVASAEQSLYNALQRLGDGIEPKREELVQEKLTQDQRDPQIMAYTRWPNDFGLKRIDAELKYNRIDPFGRSWVISLVALACFALSFGVMKKPMYIAALSVLCAGILWTAYGFYLRVYVTQWAPVTNMYETVVWVAFCVSALGAWFVLLPLSWPGLRDSWRATAFPLSFEATELDRFQLRKFDATGWLLLNSGMALLRVALMAGVFYALSIDTRYSDGQRTIFALLPNLADAGGNAGQMVQQILVWAVGFLCMLLSVWFVPRMALTFLASIAFMPWDLYLRRGGELAKLGSDVRARWPIGVGATLMSAFGAWVTWMAPSVLDESFSPLQPVLRSNFWLTVHVLTIVSSYAAGILALGIGLIALSVYIFGTYRDPVALKAAGGYRPAGHEEEEGSHLTRRPPAMIAPLAQYAYRAIQVAVLLLATGTILGGIWADRSWGRFWGWDPKEVWALVSLLVYLAILHGRFAGWFNNFGLIAGTVLGASTIVMSWYGVNFVLPKLAPDGMVGLHSYGSGAGGLPQVASFVIALWLYQAAAAVRYFRETSVIGNKIDLVPEKLAPGAVQVPEVVQSTNHLTSAGTSLAMIVGALGVALCCGYIVLVMKMNGYDFSGGLRGFFTSPQFVSAASMVMPIPAACVLVYVVLSGMINSLGIETAKSEVRVEA